MIYQDELTHISLFSGIGGDTIAAEWAGFETVLFVENDKFCQKVLNKHWPDVPIIGDIHDATKEKIMAHTNKRGCSSDMGEALPSRDKTQTYSQPSSGGVSGTALCRADRTTNRVSPITLITGGFPCQPFSVAGKQRGKEDDRYLWPEMLRVIKEIGPIWVVAENVAGLIRMGLDDCISDLENIGYTTEPYLIPACAINAPHRRDRVFIVAHTSQHGPHTPRVYNPNLQVTIKQDIGQGEIRGNKAVRAGMDNKQDVADTNREGPQGHRGLLECGGQWLTWQGNQPLEGIWESEPPVGRVAHGIPSRVDRLKALGNAIVPQQIYPILKAIAVMELNID